MEGSVVCLADIALDAIVEAVGERCRTEAEDGSVALGN